MSPKTFLAATAFNQATGRTARLLRHAISLAVKEPEKPVAVVLSSPGYCVTLAERLRFEKGGEAAIRPDVPLLREASAVAFGPGRLWLVPGSVVRPHLDAEGMRIRPGTILDRCGAVFFDHQVIEDWFEKPLDAAHAFDVDRRSDGREIKAKKAGELPAP